MIFKEIDINAKNELQPFLDIADYEACDYCFTTLYMWQHAYKTGYYLSDDFAVIVGEYEGNSFSIQPLANKENLPKAIDFIINYFNEENKIFLEEAYNKCEPNWKLANKYHMSEASCTRKKKRLLRQMILWEKDRLSEIK